jgi:hypothetical protein
MRLWRSLHKVQGLQVDRGDTLEPYVFAAFDEMYAAFERDRATLPPGRLHEIRYEDLVADPVGRMAEAYERLELGDFQRVRGDFETMAASMKRPFLDRYGYEVPATRAVEPPADS